MKEKPEGIYYKGNRSPGDAINAKLREMHSDLGPDYCWIINRQPGERADETVAHYSSRGYEDVHTMSPTCDAFGKELEDMVAIVGIPPKSTTK